MSFVCFDLLDTWSPLLSPLRLPVPPSRHCCKVLVTDRSHTFSSTRADVILRLRNPLQNPRVPYEILPPLALTARHVVARHVVTDVCFERKRVQLESYRLLPFAPPSPWRGPGSACLCVLLNSQFPRGWERTRQYILGRRRQTDLLSHLSPAAGILFSGPPH